MFPDRIMRLGKSEPAGVTAFSQGGRVARRSVDVAGQSVSDRSPQLRANCHESEGVGVWEEQWGARRVP